MSYIFIQVLVQMKYSKVIYETKRNQINEEDSLKLIVILISQYILGTTLILARIN